MPDSIKALPPGGPEQKGPIEGEMLTPQEARRLKQKRLFLDEFRAFMGIVTASCKAAGVGRSTVWEWRRDDKEFADEYDEILLDAQQDVEDRLMNAIHNNEPWAIGFYLSHKHPDYALQRKQQELLERRTLEDIIDEDEAKLAAAAEAEPAPPAEPEKPCPTPDATTDGTSSAS